MVLPSEARAGSGAATLSFERRPDATLVIRLVGAWRLHDRLPSPDAVERELAANGIRRVAFDTTGVAAWDSGTLNFIVRVLDRCQAHGVAADRSGLLPGMQRLLALAEAVPEKAGARTTRAKPPFLARIGLVTIATITGADRTLAFLGEITRAFGAMLVGRARFRGVDLAIEVQRAGVDALPIVTLISFLVGAILAFVGAVQLEQFGASIYVANLVGVAMVREMGAMMTAIVMAGRTGASYAAQLGSMKVHEEIDALTTMGIEPLEFLVLPRMVALFVMMPLLCLYSDAVGILGGAAVGTGMLGLSATLYFQQTADAIALGDMVGGVFKASVYGVLIALAGCIRGLESETSAAGVGDATTSAVVTSIVWIISACGIFAVLFYILGL